jgi:hypothetical protein
VIVQFNQAIADHAGDAGVMTISTRVNDTETRMRTPIAISTLVSAKKRLRVRRILSDVDSPSMPSSD